MNIRLAYTHTLIHEHVASSSNYTVHIHGNLIDFVNRWVQIDDWKIIGWQGVSDDV